MLCASRIAACICFLLRQPHRTIQQAACTHVQGQGMKQHDVLCKRTQQDRRTRKAMLLNVVCLTTQALILPWCAPDPVQGLICGLKSRKGQVQDKLGPGKYTCCCRPKHGAEVSHRLGGTAHMIIAFRISRQLVSTCCI